MGVQPKWEEHNDQEDHAVRDRPDDPFCHRKLGATISDKQKDSAGDEPKERSMPRGCGPERLEGSGVQGRVAQVLGKPGHISLARLRGREPRRAILGAALKACDPDFIGLDG
jgi:hypothetical protein